MADLGNTRIFGDLTVSNKFRVYDLARLDNTTVVWGDRTITAGSGLTGGGSLGGNITISHADTSSQISTSNSGRTYIQSITLDDYGHITKISSATNTDTHVGTVTSIAMTVPTGLSITGSPITNSGTLALSLTSGYSIPTTTKQGHWDIAYSKAHDSGSDNQTISAGKGMNFTSSNGDVTITLGTPSTLSASSSDSVGTSSHSHKITTTSTGSASTIVQTDTGGNLTAKDTFNYGAVASMAYNPITKSIDFNFA